MIVMSITSFSSLFHNTVCSIPRYCSQKSVPKVLRRIYECIEYFSVLILMYITILMENKHECKCKYTPDSTSSACRCCLDFMSIGNAVLNALFIQHKQRTTKQQILYQILYVISSYIRWQHVFKVNSVRYKQADCVHAIEEK
jgi:hypothetical protein